MNSSIESVIQRLGRFLERNDWRGWDPYDGLNSKFLKALTLGRKWPKIAVIQFMKKSPVNLRPILGVPKLRNPKALGLLASAYLIRYKKTRKDEYINKARRILDWLIANSTGYSGYSWGYNFDWQSAVFYIPRGVPTVVNTCFVANAFLDAYEITRDKNYLDVAHSSCDFILNDLQRAKLSEIKNDPMTSKASAFYFSYSPLDDFCVHNANLLAAELLARVYSFTADKNLYESAMKSAKFTISWQNEDGSWCYGFAPRQWYIDSFHTGFVLVSLLNYIKYADEHELEHEWTRILSRGYKYYKNTFWDEDGCPRYYNDKKYPIDLHCSAQGIVTFLKFKKYNKNAVFMAKKIANWAIENMWDDKKEYFYFRRTKLFTNKIPYLRWPNVWMYYALALLSTEGTEQRADRV